MRRATALLLAFACLWISGGATLHHTDDIAPLLHFHTGQNAVSHTSALNAPGDSCLACQWEDSAVDLHLPAVPVVSLSLALLPNPAVPAEAQFQRPFDHTSARAPPMRLLS